MEAIYPTEDRSEVELFMAVWTPGSYLIREYSRHVENVRSDLPVEKTAKNRWLVSGISGLEFTLRYRVYCREMSVRTNWVEHEFGLINGAPTFLTLAGHHDRPHSVTLELPAHWPHSVTALRPCPNAPHVYEADSFDTLVDSPILLGNAAIREFCAGERRHRLATLGDGGLFNHDAVAADLQRVVEAQQVLWNVVPYEEYVFLNVLTESAGGLEHKNSTVLMGSRWATQSRAAYIGDFDREPARHGWLGLASHEFFHVWNGKRLRPEALGPFDFEKENYTRELWFAEGVTSYYDDLILARTGLMNSAEYLASLSRHIEKLQTTPGRAIRSVELSSFDAWIREYRQDENSVNSSISYYTKGAVVAFLLDMEIRRATGDICNFDDVLRLAYSRYAGERGYTGEEIRAVINEVSGTSLDTWLQNALTTTEELDYHPALDWLGLVFGDGAATSPAAWMGATAKTDGGRIVLTQVLRDGPGAIAGLNVDDEILAWNGFRLRADHWARRVDECRPGETVELLLARRDQLLPVTLQFGERPGRAWRLYPDPQASETQLTRLRKWLHV